MPRRRLLLLGLGVTALFAVTAMATSGRPLSKSHGAGPSASFFDYVYTTIVVVAVAMALIVAYALALQRLGPYKPQRRRWHLVSTLIGVALAAAAAMIFLHSGLGKKLQDLNARTGHQPEVPPGKRPLEPTKNIRNARVRWDEIAVVLVLVGGVTVLLLASRGAKRAPRPWRLRSQDAVSLALDESVDDLRTEPDLRRAIIAAYARMERALAFGGIPRRPSEAPLEYLERALRELDTSAESVRRLTDLFQWAKFSQHEPEPKMRDDALDALVAVRDELRRPAEAVMA
jgi:energy-converting hydrogenase Eha subunit A